MGIFRIRYDIWVVFFNEASCEKLLVLILAERTRTIMQLALRQVNRQRIEFFRLTPELVKDQPYELLIITHQTEIVI